jgi:hypothetical protein
MNSRSIFLLLTLVLLTGCDPDWPESTKVCEVSGQLTLDGEAISDVKVVFVPQRIREGGEATKIASGMTNDRGEFELKIDSRDEKKILHGRYRVIVSKVVDGKELFHESYNRQSVLMVEIETQEAIQRPKLELKSTGTL